MATKLKNIVLATLFFSAFVMLPAHAAENNPATISVSGTGTVSVKPDMANISFGVRSEAKTAREALTENNKSMARVINAMLNNGIEEKDLQTSQFNIQPIYVYPKRKNDGTQDAPRITGYTVSNNVAVRVRDLGQTGKILDQVVSLGVNSGGNISFTNAETKDILKIAREKAVKDAIEKANTLAQAAGVGLGRILNISEGSYRPRPKQFAMARSSVQADESAVPIASGEETYRVDVQVNWEIDQ